MVRCRRSERPDVRQISPLRYPSVAALLLTTACGQADSKPPPADPTPEAAAPSATATPSAPPVEPPRAGPRDGICEPGTPSTAVFDPDCVYMSGTYSPSSDRVALAHPSVPDALTFGFGSVYGLERPKAVIRPQDGRLAFIAKGAAPVSAVPRLYLFTKPARSDPRGELAMQEQVPTPECEVEVRSVRAFADDGAFLVECLQLQGPIRLFVEGKPVSLLGARLLAMGVNRSILVTSVVAIGGEAEDVGTLREGVIQRVKGLEDLRAIGHARATLGGGFLVAGAIRADGGKHLFEIGPDGRGGAVGTFDFGARKGDYGSGCVLDPDGDLWCIADKEPTESHRTVVKYSTRAPPEVVYDDTRHTLKVKALVTGP